ncbi:uncharacterized protein LOC105662170 isoform X1 [Megachile rotundata]|uniref:uncharacterized protein LOC105662170 isoform X1 n=1 Tax=Megachile rotundata TaxID=143995 RepID=UPI003FD3B7CD
MGTMRNNFATVFVLLVLMLSTSQSLPHGYKNSPNRNSLEALARDARSNSIYNCLFIDRNLPICDVERMLTSNDEITEPSYESPSGIDFDKHLVRRSRRNADASAAERVVVYAIEGCIPSSIPISLPSCDGISLDKIVDVQRIRPFAVKGVKQPSLVFPEFNYRRWLRMMTRLQNHISSNKQDEQQNENFPKEIHVKVSQDRKDKLPNVATTIQTMSNVMSSAEQSGNTKTLEENESRESTSSSIENNNSKLSEASSDAELSSANSEEGSNIKSQKIEKHGEAMNNGDVWNRSENQLAIPSIPMVSSVEQSNSFMSTDRGFYKHISLNDPSNHLGRTGNSRSFLYFQNGEDEYNAIENDSGDLNLIEEKIFRRRREARLSNGLVQEIVDEPKTQGIAGKSSSQRFQDGGAKPTVNEQKHQDSEQEIFKEVSAIPERAPKPDNSRLKAFLASRKASWRRALLKEAALGKKHRNYMEMPCNGQ